MTVPLIGSRRSFRAFTVLAISVCCFFALQGLHKPIQDIGQYTASVHKVSYENAAEPLHGTAHQLDKRAEVFFGDAARNVSSFGGEQPSTHKGLVKRTNVWSLDYDTAVCKGKRLRDRIDTSSGNGRIWQYSDLHDNGWTVTKPGENGRVAAELPATLRKAMTTYGLSTSPDQNQQRFVHLDHPFKDDKGQTVENDCGYYENAYNVQKGAIVAIQNASPAYCVNLGVEPPLTPAEIKAKTPPCNRWSDVVWTIWADIAGNQAHTLRYIFRDNVVNDDSKHIMDAVMKLPLTPTVGNLHLPFPGETFDLNSDEGCALLATPHGVGVAHLLADHINILRGRKVKITIYTGSDKTRPDKANQYFMLFDMQ